MQQKKILSEDGAINHKIKSPDSNDKRIILWKFNRVGDIM